MLSVVVYLQIQTVSIMSEVIRIEVLGCDIVNLKNPLIIHFPVNNYTNHSTVSIPFQMFSKCPKICNNLLILFCVDMHRKATNIPVNTMMNKVGGTKMIVHSKMKSLSSFTHTHVVLNRYAVILSVEHKRRIYEESSCSYFPSVTSSKKDKKSVKVT